MTRLSIQTYFVEQRSLKINEKSRDIARSISDAQNKTEASSIFRQSIHCRGHY